MEIVQKYGGHVVGVDMSFSVDQSYANIGHQPNTGVAQADIMELPFKDNTFDIAFSIGVLHHTPNAQQAFEEVARTVKYGGKLAVWVYSNDGWRMKIYNMIARFYRLFTIRIPLRLLHKLCYIAIPLYRAHNIPFIGRITRILLPTSMDSIPEWQVLGTFDWYSPKYQSKHTYKEVRGWFEKCGFGNIRRLSVRYEGGDVSVVGEKE